MYFKTNIPDGFYRLFRKMYEFFICFYTFLGSSKLPEASSLTDLNRDWLSVTLGNVRQRNWTGQTSGFRGKRKMSRRRTFFPRALATTIMFRAEKNPSEKAGLKIAHTTIYLKPFGAHTYICVANFFFIFFFSILMCSPVIPFAVRRKTNDRL